MVCDLLYKNQQSTHQRDLLYHLDLMCYFELFKNMYISCFNAFMLWHVHFVNNGLMYIDFVIEVHLVAWLFQLNVYISLKYCLNK